MVNHSPPATASTATTVQASGSASTLGTTGTRTPPLAMADAFIAASAFPRIQPPTYSEQNIEAYFTSLSYWFQASGITSDDRKYYTALAQVPPNRIHELKTVIDETPANGKYEYIKEKITQHFSDSQQRRLQRIISEMTLGDSKPSHLLNEMLRVAGTALSEETIISLWTSRLPHEIRSVVAVSEERAAKRGELADRAMESVQLAQGVRFVEPELAAKPVSERTPDENELIRVFKAALREEYRRDDLRRSRRSRSHSRMRHGQPRALSRNRNDSSQERSQFCYFHRRFGQQARNCRQPCAFRRPTSPAQQHSQPQ